MITTEQLDTIIKTVIEHLDITDLTDEGGKVKVIKKYYNHDQIIDDWSECIKDIRSVLDPIEE